MREFRRLPLPRADEFSAVCSWERLREYMAKYVVPKSLLDGRPVTFQEAKRRVNSYLVLLNATQPHEVVGQMVGAY